MTYRVYLNLPRYSSGKFALDLSECPPEHLPYFYNGEIPEGTTDHQLVGLLPPDLEGEAIQRFEDELIRQLYSVCNTLGCYLQIVLFYPFEEKALAAPDN